MRSLLSSSSCNKANLSGPSLKKMKLWRLLQMQGSILNYRVPPLWPTYIGERRTTFAIKVRCYGKRVGEHIGNILGT